MQELAIATIIATMYAGPYVGMPLYCSTPQNPLFFDDTTPSWLALPVEDYVSGAVECGDPYEITFHLPDGTTQTKVLLALDAGPFSKYCVRQADGSCPHIAVDVPLPFWPVELEGNISAWVEFADMDPGVGWRGLRE